MTIPNEALVEYLGLELELCYANPAGGAVWIVADKIRRSDDIAREMLRLFHRFTRIGMSLDRVNSRGRKKASDLEDDSSSNPANNAPYAMCLGTRIRIKDHIASMHLRAGIDPNVVANAPKIPSNSLLDPRFQIQATDPIVQILVRPSEISKDVVVDERMSRPKRSKG